LQSSLVNAESSGNDSFALDGYQFSDGLFVGTYSIPGPAGSIRFREQIDFREIGAITEPDELILELLYVACSLSYYKATPATRITAGDPLSHATLGFLKSLIAHGLAEYAFRNDIPSKLAPIFSTGFSDSPRVKATKKWDDEARPLVAVGGGKDSVVTIEALKNAGMNPLLFSVNSFDAIDRCVAVSGCDYVRVIRQIDPQLRGLNESGALNGHVPVTAINSLIGLAVADMLEIGPVVMSNERSADYGNLVWNGINVNHQWSKSLEFEDLLRSVLADGGLDANRYFSLLRGYREVDIARKFTEYPQYFSSFTSCNMAFKIDPDNRARTWCGTCPKCLFVFLILAPFMPQPEILGIFGLNPLAEESNIEPYEEILGLRGNKPFECVGEHSEAAEALLLLSHDSAWQHAAVVQKLAESSKAVAEDARPGKSVDRVPAHYRNTHWSVDHREK
jgi:hypothetical protein